MTSVVEHPYRAEQHAPDPVISRGDPTPPGKIGLWLFLASEIMFFIGILGSYIVLRSGSPKIFAEHAAGLNKILAGANTLVLILSSLTMALAVEAAQQGRRGRLAGCLALTIACACGFMVIKYFEYSDKFHHYTLLAKTDSPLTISAEPNQTLYLILSTGTGSAAQYFVPGKGFEREPRAATQRADFRKQIAIPLLPDASRGGQYSAVVPAAAAAAAGNPRGVKVYARASAEPAVRDRAVRVDAANMSYQGIWIYDGHAHHSAAGLEVEGYRVPYPTGQEIDIHQVSAQNVRQSAGAQAGTWTLPEGVITNKITYGPWKNIFYASYFTLTGVHGLHVAGGIIALTILLVQSLRGKIFPAHTEYTGLYWHFVDLVWIFLFPLLYLI